MRITDLELYTPNLEQPIHLSFGGRTRPKPKYTIRAMSGLDAPEISTRFYGFGDSSGDRFYSFALPPREVVVRVSLNPNFENGESYSDVRDELYRAISSSRTGLIDIHFKSGTTAVSHIQGSIYKLEVGYFNQLPEVLITFMCEDPMLRSLTYAEYLNSDLGTMGDTGSEVHIYDDFSTAPHGFEMEIEFLADSEFFLLQDYSGGDPEWSFQLIPDGGFLTGDLLHFSDEYAKKELYISRSGGLTIIPLMDRVYPTSKWPIIFPGANSFYFDSRADYQINYLKYHSVFWGA